MSGQFTKNKKDTIPIVFTAGMYGTFLHWALSYFSGLTDLTSPHTNSGNSHRFRGPHLETIQRWREYVNNPHQYSKLVRLHPRMSAEDFPKKNINEMLEYASKAIVIYNTDDYQLLLLNNKFEKIWAHGILKERESTLVDTMAKWNKIKLDDMEAWEIREMLSHGTCTNIYEESRGDGLITFDDPRAYKLNIHDLINDFKNRIIEILNYCELPLVRDNFDEVYQDWVMHQKHLKKDQIVKTIIDSVVNNYEYNWGGQNLTLVDESFVQMELRDLHKLDLLCYNLNVFPTNTTDLKKLLINV